MQADEAKRERERALRTYNLAQEQRDADMYDLLCEELAQFIEPEADVLELACGDGQLTLPLAGLAASWTAADASEKIIKKASRNARAAGIHGVSFEVQNPAALTGADASYDLVLAANVLCMAERPARVLDEIDRVLRPEGLLIAPGYVFEGEYNDFRIWLLELGGYKIRQKWSLDEYLEYLERYGFYVARITRIRGGMLPVYIAFCRKEASLSRNDALWRLNPEEILNEIPEEMLRGMQDGDADGTKDFPQKDFQNNMTEEQDVE